MKVYLDVFYLVNFLLNLFVFEILNLFLKKKAVSGRSIAASAIGAGFAVIIVVCGIKTQIVIFVVMYLFVSSLMIRIAYGKTSFLGMVRYAVSFYLTAVFLAGGILYIKGMAGVYNTSLFFLLMTTIILVFVAQKICATVRQEVKRNGEIFSVRITYNGRSVAGTAFWDTGNNLYEPVSRKPVSIIEYKLFRHMLSENERACFRRALHTFEPDRFGRVLLRYIPFHALGTTRDYIPGICVDDMEIRVSGKKSIHTGKIWLGICDGFLSSDKEYEVLLHSKIFSE